MGRGMGMGRSAANFPYPKWVWSPAGGWWCEPKNGSRNTMIAAGIWGVITAFPVFNDHTDYSLISIPSQGIYNSTVWLG